MADLNSSINGSGEPNLAQMAKYTIALQESFENINDALSQHEAGFINEKTALKMISDIVRKVCKD
jgi:hypothetical protein